MGDISYISNDDVLLLDSYNDTCYDLDYADVLEAFNDNLSRYPDNMLVSYEDRSYTYAEGAFIANKIASYLKALGVEAQDKVAFMVERSELYMFCVLSILSYGGVYVPLDDKLPDERIKFMLEDTDSRVVIVSDETYNRVNDLTKRNILNISDIVNESFGCLDSLPVVYGDLACILYTSGTTGVPKAVKITCKSLINVCENYINDYNLDEGDVYGLFPAIGFDAGNFIISVVICAGACLAIIPDDVKLDMLKLNEYFIAHDVSHVAITTQVGKLFVESVDETSLDVLLVGGEKLGDFTSPENYRLIESYGPTESFAFVCSIDNSDKLDSSSVGFVNSNIKIYDLDDDLRRVPVGAVGELYIAGYQLADGYLNRDGETSHAFVDNPFDDEDYGVLYRTGDMVRFLPDGSLGFVGRRDNQVKIRGNRVELSEIEAVIREVKCVEDVTVQTVDNKGNNELIAYVVSNVDLDNMKLLDTVRDYVSKHKPDYMVPSYVVELDVIPLTVNGKVDKGALPDIDLDLLHVEYVAPVNKIEERIVSAFEKVFDWENISVYDDFIRLGGDSLSAIKILSLLDDMDLSIKDILNLKTPYKIAQSIIRNQIIIEDYQYGFNLIKEGNKKRNMFLIPPIGGLSFTFSDLINVIDFDGNIYAIDDFKYDLSVDEIKNIDNNCSNLLDYYYNAIKDLFQDGDIIVGYSSGCIYASLLIEKLEKFKDVGECILIDGSLNFSSNVLPVREDVCKNVDDDFNKRNLMSDMENYYLSDFKEKVIEVMMINSVWDFNVPKINSHIRYLATSSEREDDLKKISDNNYDFIFIDSTHEDIISKDVAKISDYFNI
ncbi:amino acid adenylation domain-containing protein [uncultured Methanobrevibacter sp.]|uniref:non-ribosomal peptide synthetase family protein n=1 Tax=uncultured Methanobrevibacter sp. TaxID=253161 RepID=UPI0025F8520E|nr:amino acid adenylation domain-containing protein [uncultured Methanobrevibacter sp.]